MRPCSPDQRHGSGKQQYHGRQFGPHHHRLRGDAATADGEKDAQKESVKTVRVNHPNGSVNHRHKQAGKEDGKPASNNDQLGEQLIELGRRFQGVDVDEGNQVQPVEKVKPAGQGQKIDITGVGIGQQRLSGDDQQRLIDGDDVHIGIGQGVAGDSVIERRKRREDKKDGQ